MTDHLTKMILTIAAVLAVTTAQAAETEALVCPASPAGVVCPSSSPGRIIYVRPNSVTIWEAPEPFKQVFVGSAGSKTSETTTTTQTKTTEERTDLITAIIAPDERHLVLTVSEPKENLFGFGEAIIARGNVLLYGDNGKEVAHLIVEVTPLNGPSHQVRLIRGQRSFHLQCNTYDCTSAFKPKEPTTIEILPDGTRRETYAK